MDSFRHYGASANRALVDNTQKLRQEKQQALEAANAQLQQTRNELMAQNRALEEEVNRLRRIQVDVLDKGGALPGGEVRQYLFFESTKTRKVVQSPGSTISWRGLKEESRPRSPPEGRPGAAQRSRFPHNQPRRPESARQPGSRAPFSKGYAAAPPPAAQAPG